MATKDDKRDARRHFPRNTTVTARSIMLSPDEWQIIALSLKVSGVAVLGTLPLAFLFAWLLGRARFRGQLLLDAIVHLPLVLPPVVTGWFLLLAFGRTGPIGAWTERW